MVTETTTTTEAVELYFAALFWSQDLEDISYRKRMDYAARKTLTDKGCANIRVSWPQYQLNHLQYAVTWTGIVQ